MVEKPAAESAKARFENLADEFTVLTYDRRGNSRSGLHGGPAPLVMEEQSADALAVLDANGIDKALVFGNSGGASIALDLAARHPGQVNAAVVHEPPVPAVLPDPIALSTRSRLWKDGARSPRECGKPARI